MDSEERARLMGWLVINLQALEYAIRAYLYEQGDGQHTPFPEKMSRELNSLKVGDTVPVNAMTDYDSLRRLIGRYNEQVVKKGCPEARIDGSVVDLRDALAHGRVSSVDLEKPFVLLKFRKPSGGTTSVAYSQVITAQWLKSQIRRVWGEIMKTGKPPGSPMVG